MALLAIAFRVLFVLAFYSLLVLTALLTLVFDFY